MINIYCENNKIAKAYQPGTRLIDIAKDMQITLKSQILSALVNNELKELMYEVYQPVNIKFLDISSSDGMRVYQRSLTFLLQKSLKDVLPDHNMIVEHSVSKGLYCEITNGGTELTSKQVDAIRNRMQEIIRADIPFVKNKMPTKDAIEIFEREGYTEKVLLLKTRVRFYTSVYYLDNYADYFYGPLVPSTGYLKTFGLFTYYHGVLLMFPKRDNPEEIDNIIVQNKLFEIFQERKDWNKILGASSVGHVNAAIDNGKAGDLIKVTEALHEKKYAQIADMISQRKDVKLVLIAGPSSSGKTTTAMRLAIQLKVAGLNPVVISLDNYFLNRDQTPKDENGEYDFEAIHALDLPFFNQQMNELMDGKKVLIPKFSFEKGVRYFDDTYLTVGDKDVLIVEGIHGLNPELSSQIDEKRKFRIYASALTSVALDNNNRIHTTDNRLIRRIVRDSRSRGSSALDTLHRWQSVRRGEDKNIFPFQENADVMFNSSLVYELSVLRLFVEPLLSKVPPTEPEFAEAIRLLKFISYFTPIDIKNIVEIPPTSVLREFIGFSSFTY